MDATPARTAWKKNDRMQLTNEAIEMLDLELTPTQAIYHVYRHNVLTTWSRAADNTVSQYTPTEIEIVRTIRDLFVKHHDPLPVLAKCKSGRKDCEQRKEIPDEHWSSVENNLWASGEIAARILLDLYERATW